MSSFDRVVVVFNPQSSGEAPRLAEELRAGLGWPGRLSGVEVALTPTESAGHARVLAREAARVGRPLIVSVSGDGGYNEVVDVMQAATPRSSARSWPRVMPTTTGVRHDNAHLPRRSPPETCTASTCYA